MTQACTEGSRGPDQRRASWPAGRSTKWGWIALKILRALGPVGTVVACCGALAQGSDGRTVLIGQTLIGSGPNAVLSTEPVMGIRALLSQVNGRGGVHGRRIELLQADDAYDSRKAEDNVRRFAEAGAVAVLMPIGTGPSLGALKAATEAKLAVVGPYSGAPPVAAPSPFVFPTRISFAEEYGRIVEHLFTIGMHRIAFAYADNQGARSAMEATRRAIEQRGQQMVAAVAVKQDGSDAAQRAGELAALRPAAVVLSLDNRIAAQFLPAYRATGVPASFYSFSFIDGKALYDAIGDAARSLVVSQVVPYPWGRHMPLLAEYQEAMRQAGAQQLSYGSLEGYINAKLLVEGLRRAGPQPTPAAVRRALETLGHHDLGGISVRYDAAIRTGLGFSELTLVGRDGQYTR